MYQDIMQLMGYAPAQGGGGMPVGMTPEELWRMQQGQTGGGVDPLQQLHAIVNSGKQPQPQLLADAGSLLSRLGGETDVMSPQERARYIEAVGEPAMPEKPVLPAPTITQHSESPNRWTQDQLDEYTRMRNAATAKIQAEKASQLKQQTASPEDIQALIDERERIRREASLKVLRGY